MRDGWRRVTLGEVGQIVMGQSPAGADTNRIAIGLPLLNGPTEFGPTHPTPAQWSTTFTKFAAAGDILFCVRGSTTGRMNRADQRYVIGRGVAAIRGASATDTKFLHAALEWKLPELLQKATGSTFPNISRDSLMGLSLDWPSSEQRRGVAAVLASLDDLINTNQRLSAGIESLLSALFARLEFDTLPTENDSIPLSKLVEVNPAIPKPIGPVPFVDMASLDTSGSRIAGYTERPSASAVRFTNGDALMARITPCLENGKAAYVDCLPNGATASGSTEFIVLRARDGVAPCWPYFLLRSDRFRAYAIRHMSGTSGRQRCPADSVATYPVAAPAMTALREFAEAANPLMDVLRDLGIESRELRRVRDELLPLFMSGAVSPGEVTVAS